MKFQFQTTMYEFAEDSKWGNWIYVTNAMRQVSIGTILVLFGLLLPGAMLFVELAWGGDSSWPVVLGIILLCAAICAVFLPREVTWKRWKKEFLKVDGVRPPEGEKDGRLTVLFTENGCELSMPEGSRERFQWKRIEAVRESTETWDFIDRPGFSGLSVRKAALQGGDPEAFAAFVEEKSKKKIKPRAIELSELRRRLSR